MFSLDAVIAEPNGQTIGVDKYTLSHLLNGDTSTAAFTLLSGQTLVLVCTFNNRYNIDQVFLYSAGGNVSFDYYVSHDEWFGLSVLTSGNKYYADTYGVFPAAFKVTVIASSDVDIYEIGFLSSGDDAITFGGGVLTQSVGTDVGSTTKVDIFNSGDSSKDLNVFIEDSSVSVSTTLTGVYVGKYDTYVGVPDGFGWDSGLHIGTTTSGGLLVVSGTNELGTYYTPVFDISAVNYGRVFYSGYDGGVPFGVSYLYAAGAPTVGVRLSMSPPSGVWSNGMLSYDDSFWAVPSGGAEFIPYCVDHILELRGYSYAQMVVTISGGVNAYASSVGIETPVTFSGVSPGDSMPLYISTVSGLSGDESGLYVWWV